MIMWMLMIMLSVVIMFFAVIMKMIMIVALGDGPGWKVDAIDFHLDTLQLRRHRHDQGANVSADVEHD